MEDAYRDCNRSTIYEKFSTLHVVASGLEDPAKEGPLDQAEVIVNA
jgi:hypothetical protein